MCVSTYYLSVALWLVFFFFGAIDEGNPEQYFFSLLVDLER